MELSSRERRWRRELDKYGLALRKSRVKTIHADNFGGYMIIDRQRNTVVQGDRFDLEPDDVESFIT